MVYNLQALKRARTITQDKTADLKYESPRKRVWVERGTDTIYVERWMRGENGRWRWRIDEKILPNQPGEPA